METDASAIVFNIDSPGGSVQGVPEFATRVSEAARTSNKLIVAHAELAASAAYWIGSQANEFMITEAGEVGSIGVIAQHFDATRADQNAGLDSLTIQSSELKVPESLNAFSLRGVDSLRSLVSEFYEMFKTAVLRGRPQLDIEAVATGETWVGQKAVDRGLADGVSTLAALISKLSGEGKV